MTDPRLFGPAAGFAALPLEAPEADSLNGQLHGLRLLRQLTAQRLMLAPANLAALADVDLERVLYLHRNTQGTALDSTYAAALVRLAETYKRLPISTEFMYYRAEWLNSRGEAGAAVALTREAEVRFPKSHGAARARQLRAQIEALELSFSAADIVVPGQPWQLNIQTRNGDGPVVRPCLPHIAE